ncbi:MAG: sodium/glutamate symporter [Pleurocapsa sp.]
MFNLLNVLFAFIVVGILLIVARLIKHKIRLLQTLYIPESIIAGAIALLLGTGTLGAIAISLGASPDSYLAGGLFPEEMREVWSQSPGVFINIVFAALFLGEHIPNPKEIWRKTAPQVAFGQTIAWGQYVLGILVVWLVLTPVFGINPMAGALIEIGFEGGHGTAGGMADTLTELGFPEGGDLALGLATVGIVSGILFGTALAHWGRQKGYIKSEPEPLESGDAQFQETASTEPSSVLAKRARLMRNFLIDPLSLNFGFTGMAIAIGWIILQILTLIESATWGRNGLELIGAVPLFPMALIGGIIIQVVMKRFDLDVLIVRRLQERIAGVALDLLVVTALASINLAVLGANIGVFLTLSVVGITWNVLAFVYLAPRILPVYWFERGIGDLGQSMGVTATGILLIRMVDPDNSTGAFESFGYKQLFFEPIVGGGLFTAAAPTLIARFGSVSILLLTTGLLAFWLIFGIINCKRTAKKLQEEEATAAELPTTVVR